MDHQVIFPMVEELAQVEMPHELQIREWDQIPQHRIAAAIREQSAMMREAFTPQSDSLVRFGMNIAGETKAGRSDKKNAMDVYLESSADAVRMLRAAAGFGGLETVGDTLVGINLAKSWMNTANSSVFELKDKMTAFKARCLANLDLRDGYRSVAGSRWS